MPWCMGWGEVCEEIWTRGLWSQDGCRNQACQLSTELQTVTFAVKLFTKDRMNGCVHWSMHGQQNSSVLCELHGMWRTLFSSHEQASNPTLKMVSGKVSAEYLPRPDNRVIDKESRTFQWSTDQGVAIPLKVISTQDVWPKRPHQMEYEQTHYILQVGRILCIFIIFPNQEMPQSQVGIKGHFWVWHW